MDATISLGTSTNNDEAEAFSTYGIRDPVYNFTGIEYKLDQIDQAMRPEGGEAVI